MTGVSGITRSVCTIASVCEFVTDTMSLELCVLRAESVVGDTAKLCGCCSRQAGCKSTTAKLVVGVCTGVLRRLVGAVACLFVSV